MTNSELITDTHNYYIKYHKYPTELIPSTDKNNLSFCLHNLIKKQNKKNIECSTALSNQSQEYLDRAYLYKNPFNGSWAWIEM